MSRCPGCGGVLGRDCFNEYECVQIGQSIDYYGAYDDGRRDEFRRLMEQPIFSTLLEIIKYRWQARNNSRKIEKAHNFLPDDEIPF